MRRRLNLLVSALAFALLVPATGCLKGQAETPRTVGPFLREKTAKAKAPDNTTPEQDAIIKVLDADKAAVKAGFDSLVVDSQPSTFVKMLNGFEQHFDKTEPAGCPTEFKAARKRYANAWARLRESLEKFPDAYEDVEFMDAIGALFRNDRAKGRKLGGEVMDAVEIVNGAFAEVYASAEGYGILVEDH